MFRTINLSAVLYSETWSVTWGKNVDFLVFENRVLKGIFGPVRDETTGAWRILHSEDLYKLCF
jgi:hypothetical protein